MIIEMMIVSSAMIKWLFALVECSLASLTRSVNRYLKSRLDKELVRFCCHVLFLFALLSPHQFLHTYCPLVWGFHMVSGKKPHHQLQLLVEISGMLLLFMHHQSYIFSPPLNSWSFALLSHIRNSIRVFSMLRFFFLILGCVAKIY